MLSLIFLAALFAWLNLTYGHGLLQWVHHQPPAGRLVAFLTGLALTTALATALSLFMPLGAGALVTISLPALAYGIWHSRRPKINWPVLPAPLWALLTLFFLAVLHNAALPVSNFDTGLYHAQAIQWLEKFPAVPGLANLHGRFGFNSNWFVANAWPSLGFLNLADFHPASAVLFAFTLGAMLAQIPAAGMDDQKRVGRILGALLVPAAFYTLSSEISSPGTDLPAALLTWACAWLLLTEPDTASKWIALATAPVLAVTVKLSAAPLTLFSLYAVYKLWQTRDFRALGITLATGAFILLPWLARNVILTGYLVFPQTALDIFPLDWKVPLDAVAAERDAVIAWGRLPGEPIDATLALPLADWLQRWFDDLSRGQQAIVIGSALAPLVTAGYAMHQPTMREKLIITTAGLYLGFVYWLLTAPAIRFGYGFMLGLVVLAAACLIDLLAKRFWKARMYLPAALGAVVGAYLLLFFAQSFDRRVLAEFALLPAPYPSLPTAPCQIQNATLFIGQEYQQCWDAPIPCAPYCNPNLALRGNRLAEGFYFP